MEIRGDLIVMLKIFQKIIDKVLKSKRDLVDKEVFNAGSSKNNFTKNEIINKLSRYLKTQNNHFKMQMLTHVIIKLVF